MYTNGFHDASNVIATVIASRAMTPVQAVLVVGFFEFLGPLLGGTAVADTIGGFVDISDLQTLPAMIIILCEVIAAVAWNIITWRLGIPSSSSHALVGDLIGAILVAAGGEHIVWGLQEPSHGHVIGVFKILLVLLISPVIGFWAEFIVHFWVMLLCAQTMSAFVAYMENGDADKARLIRRLEKQGDELKRRNSKILNRAFTTPMDREDIYDAIMSIDDIINYAKTTVRELEVLELQPDQYMLEMAIELRDGAEALQRGFAMLSTNPAHAEDDALAARKAEQRVERVYRLAIAKLFHPDALLETVPDDDGGSEHQQLALVMVNIFKHREVYRHMSNGADQLAHTADKLNDIIVKIS